MSQQSRIGPALLGLCLVAIVGMTIARTCQARKEGEPPTDRPVRIEEHPSEADTGSPLADRARTPLERPPDASIGQGPADSTEPVPELDGPPEQPREVVELCGRVIDEAAVPVIGASITTDFDPAQALASDEHGSFCLDAADDARAGAILVEHPGFMPLVEPLAAYWPPNDGRVLELTLRRGSMLCGRVVDESGAPVEAALVRCIRSYEENTLPFIATSDQLGVWDKVVQLAGKGVRTVTSDSSGLACVEGLLAGDWTMFVTKPGYPRLRFGTFAIPTQGSLDVGDIPLPPGAELAGRVVSGPTGEGIEGARIEGLFGKELVSARSDGAGAFRLRGLPPSAEIGELMVRHPDFSAHCERAVLRVSLEKRIALEPKHGFTLLLVDAATDKPVQGTVDVVVRSATDCVLSHFLEFVQTPVTVDDGALELDNVPPFAETIELHVAGYVPYSHEVRPGSEQLETIRLVRERPVFVTVLDSRTKGLVDGLAFRAQVVILTGTGEAMMAVDVPALFHSEVQMYSLDLSVIPPDSKVLVTCGAPGYQSSAVGEELWSEDLFRLNGLRLALECDKAGK